MADEIRALTGALDRRGQRELEIFNLLFLYPISPVVQWTDEKGVTTTYVPTPLETLSVTERGALSTAEEGQVTAGQLAVEVVPLPIDPTLSSTDMIARAQATYAEKQTLFNQSLAVQFKRYGTKLDAV